MPREDDDPDLHACEPPRPTGVTAGEVVAGLAGVAALAAIDVATGGLLSALNAIPAPDEPRTDPHDDPRVQALLATTAPPERDAAGQARCSRCARFVAFDSMTLCEHGYYCAACGRDP